MQINTEVFFRPAYYGASGWVGVILNRAGVDWEQVDYWRGRCWMRRMSFRRAA